MIKDLESKLDWTVSKLKLITAERNLATPWFSTVRDDNDAILGCVSDVYKVFDNKDLILLADQVCQNTGYTIARYVEIDGGKKVIVQIHNGNIQFKGDTFFNYLSIFNSFTGQNKLGVTLSNQLISCQNQFYHHPESGKFCFRHSGDMQLNLEQMLINIKGVEKEQEKFFDNMESFYNHNITNEEKVIFTLRLLGLELSDLESEDNKISTKTINKYNTSMDCINKEIDSKGHNLFGWFNGITNYSTYHTKSVYIGQGLTLSNNAYQECVNQIKIIIYPILPLTEIGF